MKNATLEIADGKAVLSLTNPPLNVLDIATMAEIAGALDVAAAEKDLRVLVLQAEGRAFCAGVDVGEHMGDQAKVMIETFNAFIAKFLDFPLPTVALVKGAALGGGCEMILACDMVYATPNAVFGQPEVKVGVYPPPATVLLPAMVGTRKASEMILTGCIVPADEAHRTGLITGVFPDEEFEAETGKVIDGLLNLSGSVLRHSVAVMRFGERFMQVMDPVTAHYLEKLMKTKDAAEGLTAFLEKRPPEWTHE
jgi:cyclohexa-1,5-dienecarbonyl-CoA hydratase